VFLGRALTDAALARGHEVAHFNRGLSAPPDARVETIPGDRAGEAALERLRRPWDAVVDTSGYLPQLVRRSARALRGVAPQYLFVSSISAYAGPAFDETSPLAPALDPVPEAMTMETYGALKAMCEAAIAAEYGARALVVRPGLIAGPHDPTDRFTWWPARAARGGRIAAPGRPGRAVQFIDVRDLAQWMVGALERGLAGTFNATGPGAPLAMGDLLEACLAAAGSGGAIEWIDEPFLLAHGVKPWKEMPLWLPESDPAASGFMNVPVARAREAGLRWRPVEETLADTLEWNRTLPADREWKAGLAPSREAELLRAWERRPR
jgi:2'-hydroxyisoflavone reductase